MSSSYSPSRNLAKKFYKTLTPTESQIELAAKAWKKYLSGGTTKEYTSILTSYKPKKKLNAKII